MRRSAKIDPDAEALHFSHAVVADGALHCVISSVRVDNLFALVATDHGAHQILAMLEARQRYPEQVQRDQEQGAVGDHLMDRFEALG